MLMKKIVIVNGSPRLGGNTKRMIDAFAAGVRSLVPEVLVQEYDLYSLNYRGCLSCFACKTKHGGSYGKCAVKDGLTSVLARIAEADCLVVASPVYLMDISGQTKSFLERLCFSFGSYESGYKSLAPKSMPVVTVYTMNTTPENAPESAFNTVEMFLGHVFSHPVTRICAYNTYQFPDYSKFVVEVFDEKEKAAYRDTCFPEELESAFETGRKIAAE